MTSVPGWMRLPTTAITKTEHEALTEQLSRPLTDKPIGTFTSMRRDIDAAASQAVTATNSDRADTLNAIIHKRGTTR